MIHLQESSLKKKSLYYQRQRVQWRSETQNFCNEPMDKVQEQKLKIDSEYQMADYLKPEFLPDQSIPDHIWDDLPTRGVYYMIVRNERLSEARAVIRSMEDNMKNGTSYPWVLLNNQHFSLNFRKYIKRVTRATIFFGKIDLDTWDYPYWIDVPRAEEMMMFEQEYSNVYNSARLSYHQLLRYQSGFFFHHPLFKNVEYTWRVEPGADYSCKMNQDLFMFMKEQKKKLGKCFVITMREAPQSIPTLWSRVNEFKEINPQYILDENSTIYPWIYNEREKDYNYCHFWSNFQLADLSFFRSEAYRTYFEYLDKTGNFFYERWSDAPVQTIAAALFLKKEEIHFFNEIGYTHSIATHCPYDENLLRDCSCDVTTNYDFHPDSCLKKLLKIIDPNLLDDMKSFANTKGISVPF
ncbi:hypothetical protein CU098_004420 [Rhizopus stolonifer]|uniref:Alpha 1,2-mannosyltransferase 2.4.1 n=1 Tax=Rhizopus stolonifer TaxID=4846 RepID=A0A367K1C5_RHIST|nr:hypothetical protein CU098_004420 [Rhizopus stolonifer]